ncbi:MAG: hypothetical protein GWO20_19305 [Candidatus Korarchaeota archaeon]|nr:hypothetical protein [Candidatus Korarchaeota archaeon]NIU85401.1 hypothetical protein [Candidatus Thorarchaeota archaeon]NIW15498.1 hypothetical protein [Candidatus Thorarchaeota archaeon]NIW53443.1 hypothetical protein [Candidatus Korarchaeota archaeon]
MVRELFILLAFPKVFLKFSRLFLTILFLFLLFLVLLLLGLSFLFHGNNESSGGFLLFIALLFVFSLLSFTDVEEKFVLIVLVLVGVIPILFCLLVGEKGSKKVKEAGLAGEMGEVISEIKGKKKRGKVKVGGEIWWAISASNVNLPPRKQVIVLDIEGMTLLVEPAKETKKKRKQ